MGTKTDATMAALREGMVVPVIRTSTTDLARLAIGRLREAGYTVFEVTLTVPGAVEVIEELRRSPGLTVGAGTVMSPEQARRCIAAGAQFVVSPVLVEGIVPVCHDADVAVIPGALTPTEIARAQALGATAVKVFPAGSVGGPGYLRAIRSVLGDVALVPTGGVRLENLHEYLDAGAACVGVGTDLVNDERLMRTPHDEWVGRARAYVERAREHALSRAARGP